MYMHHKSIFWSFLILGVFLVGVGYSQVGSRDTVRVLTIGNSFADNATRYLEEISSSVPGKHLIVGKANLGGAPLDRHTDFIKKSEEDATFKPYGDKSLKDWLELDHWDIVTIQQVSHKSYKAETYHPYVDELITFIRVHAPEAEIYIHQTWEYAPDCPRLDEFGITSNKMYRGLKKNYRSLSKEYGLRTLNSGDAFHRARKKFGMDLWNESDRFHANSLGCYLGGLVWFSGIFQVSPEEVKFLPSDISVEEGRAIKKLVPRL